MLGLKLCSGYSFSSIEGALGLDIRGGYSICSIYGVYRGWKFAVVTAFAMLTCTRHCSWTSVVVTEFVVFMGRWGWTLSVLTGYVAFMECWCWTFAVVTAFVVFMGGGGGVALDTFGLNRICSICNNNNNNNNIQYL